MTNKLVCSLPHVLLCAITHAGCATTVACDIQDQEMDKFMSQSIYSFHTNCALLPPLQPLLGGLAWPSDERSGFAR